MPRNMAVDRPDRVIVIGTVEDYMTVEHKMWENKPAARGSNELLGWFIRRIWGHPLEEPEWKP
jgi:hypothetical protein